MLRKKKLIYICILIFFYLLITVNFHRIKFALSMWRLYREESIVELPIQEKGEDILTNPLEPILEGYIDQAMAKDKPDNREEDKKDAGEGKQLYNKDEIEAKPNKDQKDFDKTQQTNTGKKADISNDEDDYIAILTKYKDLLTDLQASFEASLDELIQAGIRDYSQGDLTNTQLASKYLLIGSKLEKSSDKEFQAIMKKMDKDLKNKKEKALIIEDIKSYYTSVKDHKKTELINKGMKYAK